jgi:hypothetical protein
VNASGHPFSQPPTTIHPARCGFDRVLEPG